MTTVLNAHWTLRHGRPNKAATSTLDHQPASLGQLRFATRTGPKHHLRVGHQEPVSRTQPLHWIDNQHDLETFGRKRFNVSLQAGRIGDPIVWVVDKAHEDGRGNGRHQW